MKRFSGKIFARTKTSWWFIALVPLFWLLTGGSRHNDFEISKNLDIFATVFRQLNANYADEINPGRLTKTAIDAMLGSLDPFTVYLPEADIEDYRITQAGQSGSVGFQVMLREGRYIVVAMNNGGAASELGIRIGDELLSVENKELTGKSEEEVNQLLTGQAGSKVEVSLKRPYTNETLDFALDRKFIKEQTVPWSGMPADDIAYINLKSFTQTASAEIREALLKLTSQHQVKGLVLDLRGNGGGLLVEAVSIANFFVKQNEIIVSTRGRIPDRNKVYRTFTSPVDMSLPVVILMDEMSASASEIVAGSLQDLDRAVIIGQRSYGKGLVQNVVPLVYNAQLKVTIAKYYIPSGRCIQAIDYFDPSGSHQVPDSLIRFFKTRNGRQVPDGKGILPDIPVAKPAQSPVVRSLVTNYLIFDFATWFRSQHSTIDPPESFSVTSKIWDDFTDFATKQGFLYRSDAEEKLSEFTRKLESEGYGDLLKNETAAVKQALAEAKKSDLMRHREEITRLLKKELVYRYYFDTGLVKMGLAGDTEMQEAYRILRNPALYKETLAGGYRPL